MCDPSLNEHPITRRIEPVQRHHLLHFKMLDANLTSPDPDARFPFPRENTREQRLRRSRKNSQSINLSRRKFLRYCQAAPLAFLSAPLAFPSLFPFALPEQAIGPHELQLHPEYRIRRGIETVLRKVTAGFDEFINEKVQDEIAWILNAWSAQLLQSPRDATAIAKIMSADFRGAALAANQLQLTHETGPIKVWRVQYPQDTHAKAPFLASLVLSLSSFSKLITAEFQIIDIRSQAQQPTSGQSTIVETVVRFEFVGTSKGFHREQRIGHWQMRWARLASGGLSLQNWQVRDESRSRSSAPIFADITTQVLGSNRSYASQLQPGTDYWRTVLDSACGIDIYGHNGVSVADIDGDGLDDLYVCQPAGLPNRLFRNRGDGTFEDITEFAGVGVLENTACALFADIDNDGHQDLIVVRAGGPLLFLNRGNGKFRLKPDAFQFANPPQGTFTAAAAADYDRDGWLDVYFCLYSYYQGADQYRYPMPYTEAENGPPNFLMRNNRDGTFRDVTKQSGLDKNNTRFSFACAWGDYNGDLWPDLYVVNDFGRKNLYRNNGDGTFTDIAAQAGVEDVGAGMSGAWLDFDNDGREDLYVADMWTAAGIRVSMQDNFQKDASPEQHAFYRRHSMGNCLYRNSGADRFEDAGTSSGATMGRWSWSSDSWDFDHDGYPDLYIANGMISGPIRDDLNSFFWRQIVAQSPNESRPKHEYEQGWNAINELIRSDYSWSGFERNNFYLNNRNGKFSDISGVIGLDFPEDSRTFALADFDQDGRLEVVLKNRNSPQLRYLKNVISDLPPSISLRLTGKKSNRDAVGARVTVETDAGRQVRILRAGSGFLAQHTKEMLFGLGSAKSPVRATIHWPSGLTQTLHELPYNHRVWIEEGQPPARIEPFKKSSGQSMPAGDSNPPVAENLPHQAETWLLVPVLAADFSLVDGSGRTETLSSHLNKSVLLHFWSESLRDSQTVLDELERSHQQWAQEGLQLLTIEVDVAQQASGKETRTLQDRYSFPVFAASKDVLATYSLLYRQLFDRHRDMTIPISFLIDPVGNIVKVYQGALSADHVANDFKSIPQTDTQRLAKALPFPGASETFDFERNYLSLGFTFYERGYFDQAEAFYRQAVKDDPQGAEPLYGLGSAYLQQQKTSEARECFERVLKLHASYPGTLPNAWNNLGILTAREGNTDVAIEHFQRALQIDPEHSIALVNLGNAFRQKKDWAQARHTLERALALNPDDPEANYSIGMVYAQQNDSTRAYEYLQKALSLRPVYPEALNNLGILYLRTRRPEEAVRSFEESIRVAPDYDQSYLNLARVYVIEGDREKARGVLQNLLKQRPGHAQAEAELKQLQQ
jgi:tetratricopeptide (TPR) repeat protein